MFDLDIAGARVSISSSVFGVLAMLRVLKEFVSHSLETVVIWHDGLLSVPVYNGDGMRLKGRSLDCLASRRFRHAYARGMNSGHHIARPKGSTRDIGVDYRCYVECWAAEHALRLKGDLVCCGVNTGIMPLAICEYIDFNASGKTFWLFDTFAGIPEAQMSETERPARVEENAAFYSDCYDVAKRNFAPYPKTHLVRGTVPETLSTVDIERVAYLSIDMNIAYPERKAIEYFWPKLVPSAIVILDDYAHAPYRAQKLSMDEFAATQGVSVLTLPTGQGMLVKPHRS
jgi:O-methyltransferase